MRLVIAPMIRARIREERLNENGSDKGASTRHKLFYHKKRGESCENLQSANIKRKGKARPENSGPVSKQVEEKRQSGPRCQKEFSKERVEFLQGDG